jgi:hypothetical protein
MIFGEGMSDAIDDKLNKIFAPVYLNSVDVRRVTEAREALQDLFYTEVMELIGEDEQPEITGPHTISVANHRNWLRESMRVEAKAKWGKA